MVSSQKFLETNKYSIVDQENTGQKAYVKYLDNRMHESEEPSLKINEVMALSIETVTGLIEAISVILFPEGLNNNEIAWHPFEIDEYDIAIPWSVSNLLLRILTVLIEKLNKDINIQSLLNSIQTYINMTGIKRMTKERD